jgi:hypothetical protein
VIPVSPNGDIGPLHLGRSSAAAIVAFAGAPDVRRPGRLGYECSTRRREFGWQVGGRWCRVVFFMNPRTHRLGDLFTSSARYGLAVGIRVGTPTAIAERRLRRLAYEGCSTTIYAGTKAIPLTAVIAGGVPHPLANGGLHLVGGHVAALVLHSGTESVGTRAFDCW